MALNGSLGSVARLAYFAVEGKGYEKHAARTDVLVSKVHLEPSRAGLTDLQVINLHFNHRMANPKVPGNWQARQTIYAHIADVVRAAPPNVPTLLGGDFNSQHWRALQELRERNLDIAPLELPKGTDEYRTAADHVGDEWPDCLCLYWIGATHMLPVRVNPCYFQQFDPQRQLIGHGAHWPIACFLGGNQPLRSDHARRAKRQRRRMKGSEPPHG